MNLFFCFCLLGSFVMADEGKELVEFRRSAEDSIKKNWLVVVGLEWLKDGLQTLGSSPTSDLKLPAKAPAQFAKVDKKNHTVTFTVLEKKGVKINGKDAPAGTSVVLQSDKSGQKTLIEWGSLQIFLIDRPKGLGLRIKDVEAEAAKAFSGISWWEPKKEYIAQGKWKPLKVERVIKIPDVQGEISEEKISGTVVFELQGQKQELYPTRDGDSLFFVFKDLTSGKTSYGPGRFLSAEVQKDGTVIMDFNRATNPPCAYVSFATCPLPPIENYMKIAIEAGAQKPKSGH